MTKFDNLNKKFLKDGFLIEKVENRQALKYINNLIKNKLCDLLKLKKSKKFSINNIHNFTNQSELNSLRVKLINYLNNDKKFRVQYFEIAKNILFSVKGNKIKPIKIMIGSFTKSHIGIYKGSKFCEYMHLPSVKVQTLFQ